MERAWFQVESIVVRVVSISHLPTVARSGECRIWDPHLAIEEELERSNPVLNVKFSRDGSKLAVARDSGQVEVWTVSNWESQWTTAFDQSYTYLEFSADNSKIACKNYHETIVVDAESGKKCNDEDSFDFESAFHVHQVDYVS